MAGKVEVLFVFCLALIVSVINAAELNCERQCKPYPTPEKRLELKCKRSNMFYVDVRCSKTANHQCSGSVACSGLQQDVLRQVAEDCYWNKQCYISMNNSNIYPIVLNLEGQCTNEIPDVMESRALCVKKKKIFDFYGMRTPVTKKEGVVTISQNFPWDYSTGTVIRSIRFRAKQRKKLRMTFLELDWDFPTDQLVVRSGDVNRNLTSSDKGENLDFRDGDVVLEFSVGSTSRRGRGFLFCFVWLSARSNNPTHACRLVRGVKCITGKPRG